MHTFPSAGNRLGDRPLLFVLVCVFTHTHTQSHAQNELAALLCETVEAALGRVFVSDRQHFLLLNRHKIFHELRNNVSEMCVCVCVWQVCLQAKSEMTQERHFCLSPLPENMQTDPSCCVSEGGHVCLRWGAHF